MTAMAPQSIFEAFSLASARIARLTDYSGEIALRIAAALREDKAKGGTVHEVSRVKSDLHPTGGYLISSTKAIRCEALGAPYRVTIERADYPSDLTRTIEDLLAAPDLNTDNLEPETRKAIKAVRDVLARREAM